MWFSRNIIGLMLTSFTLLTITCNSEKSKERALRKKIIGEWQSMSLDIKINSLNNTDSSKTISANETNWEDVLNIKPIHTYFHEDSTYYSLYRNLKNEVVGKPKGKWYVKGDTLYIVQDSPTAMNIKYFLNFKENTGEFRGRIDFDDDGKLDDEFISVNRYIAKK